MRLVIAIFACLLSSCGGTAWNTTVADHPQVRAAMLASVRPGMTTEKRHVLQWGHPTQEQREGGQVAYIYRNMANPPGYYAPQFGRSDAYVVVLFQYGVAVGAYSSDTEGCRATFAPRPPGPEFDTPSTVHAVNCGVVYDGSTGQGPIAAGIDWLRRAAGKAPGAPAGTAPTLVPEDSYSGGKLK